MARGPTVGVFTRAGRISRNKARIGNTVSEWAQENQKRMTAIFRLSTQRVIEVMQEYVPYQDGFLRASLVVLVNKDPPPANRTPEESTATYNPAEIVLAIASAVPGDRIVAAYTMEYAKRLEFGFVGTDSLGRMYNQEGRGWTKRATQQWKQINTEVEAEAKARVAARGLK